MELTKNLLFAHHSYRHKIWRYLANGDMIYISHIDAHSNIEMAVCLRHLHVLFTCACYYAFIMPGEKCSKDVKPME